MTAPSPPVSPDPLWGPVDLFDLDPTVYDYWFVPLGATDESHFAALWWAYNGDDYDLVVGLFESTATGPALVDRQVFPGWVDGGGNPLRHAQSANGVFHFAYLTDSATYTQIALLIVSSTGSALNVHINPVSSTILSQIESYNYRFALSSDGTHWAVQGYLLSNGYPKAWIMDVDTSTVIWSKEWAVDTSFGANFGMFSFPRNDCIIAYYSSSSAAKTITALGPSGSSAALSLPESIYNNSQGPGYSWDNTDIGGFMFRAGNFTTSFYFKYFTVSPSGSDWTITAGEMNSIDTGQFFGILGTARSWLGLTVFAPLYNNHHYLVNSLGEYAEIASPAYRTSVYSMVSPAGYTAISAMMSTNASWWGSAVVAEEFFPVRMSQRPDGLGVVQRTTRINGATKNQWDSPAKSSRIYGTGSGSYDPYT